MIHVQIDREYWSTISSPDLRKAAKAACKVVGLPQNVEFTVVITGDDQVRALNSEYRQVAETTDVLSFPADEEDPETGKDYIGDIIISYPRAVLQANAAGHATGDELTLLVIHGVLHLAGHDHADARDKKIMFDLQNEALNQMNIFLQGFNV